VACWRADGAPTTAPVCPLQACGSGGTTAGLALGNHLAGYGARVHAYGEPPPRPARRCQFRARRPAQVLSTHLNFNRLKFAPA
jgi:hypothetical protein